MGVGRSEREKQLPLCILLSILKLLIERLEAKVRPRSVGELGLEAATDCRLAVRAAIRWDVKGLPEASLFSWQVPSKIAECDHDSVGMIVIDSQSPDRRHLG